MPYSASALGVLPPLWSSAAKKPGPALTLSCCASFMVPFWFTGVIAPNTESNPVLGLRCDEVRPEYPQHRARLRSSLVPLIAELVPENRQFLSRAATWVANQGIGQFIDLGCGMPTAPNTHESARAIIDDARVVYVDNDPVVVNHLLALLAKGNPGVTVVDGDVRDVAAVLDTVGEVLDLSAPTCLVVGY